MTSVGEREIRTQRRVIRHFRDSLGYSFLGNWHERQNNRNIEEDYLRQFLAGQGHDAPIITKALDKLDKAKPPLSAEAERSTTPTATSTVCFAMARESAPDSANRRSPST